MCSIAGIIDLNKNKIDSAILARMSQTLQHRGPDDEGYILINSIDKISYGFSGQNSRPFFKSNYPPIENAQQVISDIGFAHNRFSIIDITDAGHQPFYDETEKNYLIFNGEIYNYLEIRNQLELKGIVFHSNSDTEVILKAYKYYGTNCFNLFNGFWALALYDAAKDKVIVSRDRFGKKPLFYYRNNSQIFFASEIKALLKVIPYNGNSVVNDSVVYNWLASGLKDLDSQTFFNNVYSFPAGSYSILDSYFPQNITQYWKLNPVRKSEKEVSVKEASESVLAILEDSIKLRMRADVPVCVELSGGLDSSAITSLACINSKDKINSYTVRFPEKEWNEERYAFSVAKHFDNINYNVIDNPIEDFWSKIIPFTFLEEEPYHSPNLQTNQVIWARMRSQGMKVSLNGAAGDELFAGYGTYYYPAQIENVFKIRVKTFTNNLNWKESYNKFKTTLHILLYYINHGLKIPINLKSYNNNIDYIKLNGDAYPDYYKLSDILFSDMLYSKMPYWLRSGDRGYMGIPLEVRAPFLDYRLAELAFSLPTSYLIRNGWHKWILRKALEKVVPHDVLWRKNKMGFPFPYSTFFTKYKDIIDLILNKTNNPYLDYNQKELFKNNWKILSFILWYEYFNNHNMKLFESIVKLSSKNIYSENSYLPAYLNNYKG